MRRLRASVRGLTLIELAVTLTVLSILAALATPPMRAMVANAKVRSVADSVASGLAIAQADAMRRSRYVEFLLTDGAADAPAAVSAVAKSSGRNWIVRSMVDSVRGIDARSLVRGYETQSDGAATITHKAGAFSVAFASTGKAMRPTRNFTLLLDKPTVFYIDAVGADRPLCVYVVPNGTAKTCDPALPSSDFRACAPALADGDCAP